MAADQYVYPDTEVLRNLLDLRDAAHLGEREAALSAIRIAQLERRFIPGDFDLTHLQATHRYIFGDIYSWAGELRTVRITKGGDLFALPEHVGPYLTRLLADLARENRLQGLGFEQFVERLTHYYAEINAVHPFREGNGRAQRAFLGARSPRPPAIRSRGSTSILSATYSPPARVTVATTHHSTRCSATSCNNPRRDLILHGRSEPTSRCPPGNRPSSVARPQRRPPRNAASCALGE